MIINSNQLTDQQLKDLEQLGTWCKKADGSVPNLYTHVLAQPRLLPAALLYYEQQQLLGFLSAFFFYDEAVELSLLVHPDIRRKGVGKQLINIILPLLQSQNYSTVICSAPTKLNDAWFKDYGFTYRHSEYFMERHDLQPLLHFKSTMTFRNATHSDIPMLCAIDEVCFAQHQQGDPHQRFEYIIDNREYQIVLALQHDQIIGKAHFRWGENGATLSDIAIIPTHQGQGLGTALITYCINVALSEGKPHLNLDVETHNQKALELYTRLGFSVSNACDYWAIDIKKLIPFGI